jgi:DNA polymerase-1
MKRPTLDMRVRKDLYLLVDTGAFFYRAMFAMRDFTGEDLKAMIVNNIMEVLFDYCKAFHTNNLVFLFDSTTSKRKAIYPDYKKKRNKNLSPEELDQLNTMQELRKEFRKVWLPKLGFNNTFVRKGLESDDLIAAITGEWLGDFIILTSDRDLWQCIAANVRWSSVANGDFVDLRAFQAITKLKSPTQWVTVKSFGCASDNVKGIPGVGEPSAIKYIRGELTGKKLAAVESAEGQAILKRNLRLVKLPFKPLSLRCETTRFSPSGFGDMCCHFGLKHLHKKVGEWSHHFTKR